MHRTILLVLSLCVCLSPVWGEEPLMLLSIQGKGSSAAYDLGVITRLQKDLPALQSNRVVISASSSGSILATFFCTHGFTEASIAELTRINAGLDRQAIRNNENLSNKASKIMSSQPIELSHDVMKETIAGMLGVTSYSKNETIDQIARRSQVRIVVPVVIVAANYDVVNVKKPSLKDYRPLDREVEYDSYSVFWTEDAYRMYRADPKLFARVHPDLKLGPTRYVGKACTYFCDQTMFDLLSRIPESQRLGDLRLMTNPSDLALAILASVSEPTYFFPIDDNNPAKIMAGENLGSLGNIKKRSYCGGFIMPVVAQDVRRVHPDLFTLNTGGGDLPLPVKLFLESNYLLAFDRIQRQNDWWIDLSCTVRKDIWKRMGARDLTDKEEFQAGYDRAAECLISGRGLPRYVHEPKYNWAITGSDPEVPRDKLPTMRGLLGPTP